MKSDCYLIKPGPQDEAAIIELTASWHAFGGRFHPGLLRDFPGDFSGDFPAWLRYLEERERGLGAEGKAPQSLYLLKRADGTILGATGIRHFLTEDSMISGGHIGYGIRPEFRKQGYGDTILALALIKLRELGVTRALVTCECDNTASERVIINNGGVLENDMFDEKGRHFYRYWIAL